MAKGPAGVDAARPREGATGGPGAGKGFTLIEAMVVIAIIALLMAILLPELSAARSLTRSAICQSNLSQISKALIRRTSDERCGQAGRSRVGGWPGALLPYVAGESEVLTCPDSGEFAAVSMEQILEVRMYGGGFNYQLQLNGPFVAKMSDTQYQACKAAGWMRHGKVLAAYAAYAGYVPDGNDDVVWFCIEEITPESEGEQGSTGRLQHGDPARDYEDVRMRVTDRGDGTFDLYFDLGSGGLSTAIINADTGEVLARMAAGYPRGDQACGPFEGSFSDCSYGMNAAAYIRDVAPEKILAVDYHQAVARSTDVWTDAELDPDGDGVPGFARHRGQMNVLFADKSVKTMFPHQIDPANPSVAEIYWETLAGP